MLSVEVVGWHLRRLRQRSGEKEAMWLRKERERVLEILIGISRFCC
jgi:hypothetical protein